MDFLYLKQVSKSYDGTAAAGIIILIIIAVSVSDVFFTIRNLSNISRQKVSGADTLKIIKGGGIGKEWK